MQMVLEGLTEWRNIAGYFTQGKRMTEEELRAVQGRLWEE